MLLACRRVLRHISSKLTTIKAHTSNLAQITLAQGLVSLLEAQTVEHLSLTSSLQDSQGTCCSGNITRQSTLSPGLSIGPAFKPNTKISGQELR